MNVSKKISTNLSISIFLKSYFKVIEINKKINVNPKKSGCPNISTPCNNGNKSNTIKLYKNNNSFSTFFTEIYFSNSFNRIVKL